ncbi:hypothetical protein [Lysobacter fragariae]
MVMEKKWSGDASVNQARDGHARVMSMRPTTILKRGNVEAAPAAEGSKSPALFCAKPPYALDQ